MNATCRNSINAIRSLPRPSDRGAVPVQTAEERRQSPGTGGGGAGRQQEGQLQQQTTCTGTELTGLRIIHFLGASEEQTRKTEAKGMLLRHSFSFYKLYLIRMTGSVGWGCWSLSQWSLRERRECSLDIVHYCVAGYSLIYSIF